VLMLLLHIFVPIYRIGYASASVPIVGIPCGGKA